MQLEDNTVSGQMVTVTMTGGHKRNGYIAGWTTNRHGEYCFQVWVNGINHEPQTIHPSRCEPILENGEVVTVQDMMTRTQPSGFLIGDG